MFNHRDSDRQTKYYFDDESRAFVVEAFRDIKKDEPIHIIYGDKGNLRFFLDYGFIDKQSTHDQMPLNLQLDPTDPAIWVKNKLLPPEFRK